jgi:hypothetical protein
MSLFSVDVSNRLPLSGTVISFKTYDTVHGVITKMLVRECRDFNLYGTVPSNILAKVKVGDRVEFVARIHQIKTYHFAHFKNPTRGRIIT